MILHKRSCQETLYDILNVEESASYEDIRGAYRSALLDSHPDKLRNSFHTQNLANESSGDRFIKVQKAWETLSDARSRALYDTELRALRTDEADVADDISLADMAVEEGEGDVLGLYHQCRCGDYFSVSSFELEEEMGYRLSTDEQGEIHAETPNSLPATITTVSCPTWLLGLGFRSQDRAILDSNVGWQFELVVGVSGLQSLSEPQFSLDRMIVGSICISCLSEPFGYWVALAISIKDIIINFYK